MSLELEVRRITMLYVDMCSNYKEKIKLLNQLIAALKDIKKGIQEQEGL